MTSIEGFTSVDGKRPIGYTPSKYFAYLDKTLSIWMIFFLLNDSRVVDFDVPVKFSIQHACDGFWLWLFKACLNAHISLKRQAYMFFVSFSVRC
jgi:hypothetical protein